MSAPAPPKVVVVNDASCLIDLYKGGLLPVFAKLPYRLVVPLPIRESEVLDFTEAEWRFLDEAGLETFDLPGDLVAAAMAVRRENASLSANDCFCLVTAQRREEAILLTGDGRLRRVAADKGVRVHGVLWIVDELEAAGLCPAELLIGALEIWAADETVFLPAKEITTRLTRLRRR